MIVGQETRSGPNSVGLGLGSHASQTGNGHIDATGVGAFTGIVQKQLTSTNVVHHTRCWSVARGGSFAFEFKDNHTTIVTGSQEILRFVCGEDPEAIPFASKGLYTHTLIDVPYANGAIFGIGYDQFVLGVKETARDIVGVSSKGIDLPGLGFRHAPQFDLSIVGCRSQERKSRMKASPIDSAVMSFQDILDDNIVGSKQFRLYIESTRLFVGILETRHTGT